MIERATVATDELRCDRHGPLTDLRHVLGRKHFRRCRQRIQCRLVRALRANLDRKVISGRCEAQRNLGFPMTCSQEVRQHQDGATQTGLVGLGDTRRVGQRTARVPLVRPELTSFKGRASYELADVYTLGVETKAALGELRDVSALSSNTRKRMPDARMISRSSRCEAFTSPSMPLKSTSEKPSTAFRGVRNSCRSALK